MIKGNFCATIVMYVGQFSVLQLPWLCYNFPSECIKLSTSLIMLQLPMVSGEITASYISTHVNFNCGFEFIC